MKGGGACGIHRAMKYTSVDIRIACTIGPKGEARTLGLRAPWGPYIQEIIYMGWVQLSFLVRPKNNCICHQSYR